jgi:hypothetical protein
VDRKQLLLIRGGLYSWSWRRKICEKYTPLCCERALNVLCHVLSSEYNGRMDLFIVFVHCWYWVTCLLIENCRLTMNHCCWNTDYFYGNLLGISWKFTNLDLSLESLFVRRNQREVLSSVVFWFIMESGKGLETRSSVPSVVSSCDLEWVEFFILEQMLKQWTSMWLCCVSVTRFLFLLPLEFTRLLIYEEQGSYGIEAHSVLQITDKIKNFRASQLHWIFI